MSGPNGNTPGEVGFSLFGIPVRVHPFFWLMAAFLGMNGMHDLKDLVVWVSAVFISILVHELGHAFSARYYGCHPLITLHGMGGLTHYDPRFAGAQAARTLSQILITLAGPVAGFVFATLIALAIRSAGHRVIMQFAGLMPVVLFEPFSLPVLTELLDNLLFVNIIWGIFNLLPIYPLDGGHVARQVFVAVNPRAGLRASLILSIVVAVALVVYALRSRDNTYIAVLFGYFAYLNFMTLREQQGRYPW